MAPSHDHSREIRLWTSVFARLLARMEFFGRFWHSFPTIWQHWCSRVQDFLRVLYGRMADVRLRFLVFGLHA